LHYQDDPEATYDKIITSMVCIDCVLGKLGRVSKDEKTMKKVSVGSERSAAIVASCLILLHMR
jgi:hypothetical protein